MKVFIVSMAIVIIGVSCIVFSWDMNYYSCLQTHLKALTESCAACGALSFRENVFLTERDIVYGIEDVKDSVEHFLAHAVLNMPYFDLEEIEIIEIIADSEEDFVELTLRYDSKKDIFRLAFVSAFSLTHTSSYQWITAE